VNSLKLAELRALIPNITWDLGRTSLNVIGLEELGQEQTTFEVGNPLKDLFIFEMKIQHGCHRKI